MATIKSGVLKLSDAERRALETVIRHTRADISYGEGGSFNKEGKDGQFPFDQQEAKRAERGLDIIEFILQAY